MVVVVGVCSSGKSTLVSKLKEIGYNARAVAQEHSYVPHLWQLSRPDVLVYLDASLHSIRERRRVRWRQQVLDEEHRRLAHAREHCDLYIPTDGLLPEDVAARVVNFLHNRDKRSRVQSPESKVNSGDSGLGTLDSGLKQNV
jgi:RNase adaptor protein for sRNA GlmZ degradation